MGDDTFQRDDSQPLYRRIYRYIEDEISSSRLRPGDRVLSEKELCEKFGVSRITSKRALELLSEKGLVSRFPGKGSFVADSALSQGASAAASARTIGLLIPNFSDAFGSTLICSVGDTCASLGYHLFFRRTQDSIEEEKRAIESLLRADVAGVLVLPVHGEYYNPEILKLILEKRPLVFVDRKMRGLAAPSVSTDNIAAAKIGVEYLMDLGHRSIAFYSGPVEHTSTVEDRKLGFVQAYADRGIPTDSGRFCMELSSVWAYPYDRDQVTHDIQLVRSHLIDHPDISAAFVTEYFMGPIVQSAARSLGKSVPEDFSILSFDAPFSIVEPPPFTYLRQDEFGMGSKAVELLHSIILGANPTPTGDIFLPAELLIGASTAPKHS